MKGFIQAKHAGILFAIYLITAVQLLETNFSEIIQLATGQPQKLRNETISPIDRDQRLSKWNTYLSKISDAHGNEWTHCTCDLNVHRCDIECCCDADCEREDKYAFYRCRSIVNQRSDKNQFCQSSRTVFDRKKFQPAHQSSGMLCVLHDNSNQKQLLLDRKTISDLDELTSIKSKYAFKWSDSDGSNMITTLISVESGVNATLTRIKSMLEYKSGNSIFRSNGIGATEYWRLPSTLNSNGRCNHMRPVAYLQPFESSCMLMVHQLKHSCSDEKYLDANNFYRNINFHYYDFINDDHRLIPIKLEGNYSSTYFDVQNGNCHNVVTTAEYTVKHRGIYGITQVSLRLHQISVSNITRVIKQKFSVQYVWAETNSKRNDSSNNRTKQYFSLSGNPGYIRERGLLFATRRDANESFLLLRNILPNDSLRPGTCKNNSDSDRSTTGSNIAFGINQFHTCRLRFELSIAAKKHICGNLTHFFSDYWHDKQWTHLFVAVYGNGNLALNQTDQWVPVLLLPSDTIRSGETNNRSLCANLIRRVSFVIYFARVGHEEEAQHKVVAATIQRDFFTPGDGLTFKCMPKSKCSVKFDAELVTLVDFVDVTMPVRPEYSPAPSVKIELPNDFFYPFQSTNSPTTIALPSSWTLNIITTFVLIFFFTILW